mmetsp:Transcript_40346/g.48901  ORF Transcript_40346/g.48901 Transcript_40346/m.48901 type:complete len:134 (+) Transcript_40346:60-461(+)|eukprot:CAMPEP_0197852606 /NCGR_PEP_ID=MMETSP1438-20131217/21054_1 /TAXON_ID=1461541 /ORGANISM="Pterosperma sp., Strain CCMP1384" /LENGTH=133 /DNA_ID=CAMNT_0043466745 /DNA_START=60 /DNA_END=461 /DNA_ORIENTATION=-
MNKCLLILSIIAAAATIVGAALPPGYDEELYCAQYYCLRPKHTAPGFTGPRTSFFECYSESENDIQRPTAWGENLGVAEKNEHLTNCMHTSECEGFTADSTCVPGEAKGNLSIQIQPPDSLNLSTEIQPPNLS